MYSKMNRKNNSIVFYYFYVVMSAAILTRGIFLIYLEQKGLSVAEITLYSAFFNVCTVISEIPTGYIGDRIGRKNSLIIGVVLVILQCILMIYVEKAILLILLGGLEAIAYTFVSGSEAALLYYLLDKRGEKEKYLKVNANLLIVQSVTTGSSIWIGAKLVKISWELPYIITAILLGISIFALLGIKEEKDYKIDEEKKVKSGEKGILRENIIFQPILLFMIFFIGISLIDGISGAYYNLNQIIFIIKGFEVSTIGLFFTISYFVNIFAYLSINILTIFLKRTSIIILSLMLQCVGFFLLSVSTSEKNFLIISLLLCFVPEVIFTVADSIVQDYIKEENRATILSIMSLFRALCSGIIYGIFGMMLEIISLNKFFLLLAVGMGSCAIIGIWWYLKRRKSNKYPLRRK